MTFVLGLEIWTSEIFKGHKFGLRFLPQKKELFFVSIFSYLYLVFSTRQANLTRKHIFLDKSWNRYVPLAAVHALGPCSASSS